MKTAISLPDHVFDAADRLAERMGVTRSHLYATALAEFLARHSEADITARLNAVYGSEDSALDPGLRRAQARALREGMGPDGW